MQTARDPDRIGLVKASLERTAAGIISASAELPAEATAHESLMQFAARAAAHGDNDPAERARQDERSPALWAAMGALAGAELSWALPQVFGIGT